MAKERIKPGQRRYEVQFETTVLESYYVNAFSKDEAIAFAEQKILERGSEPADDVVHIDTKYVTVIDSAYEDTVCVLNQEVHKRKKRNT